MIPISAEVVRLLEFAAGHPEGAAALFEGQLEAVAALYQVHPATVERLRACLAEEGGRASVGAILERARRAGSPAPRGSAARHPRPGCAGVLARARALPGGLELLVRAPLESAAVLLQAHPFVIEAVRRRVAAAGLAFGSDR